MQKPALIENQKAKTGSTKARAFSLVKPSFTYAGHETLLNTLNVENSPRYQPAKGKTYCNIYAHDYAHLAGVYLPRTWWTTMAQKRILKGEDLKPVYGAGITYEMNANGMYDWLLEDQDRPEVFRFGWKQLVGEDEAIQYANTGKHIVVCCAAQRNIRRSGHITIILPEHERLRKGLWQSQAGIQNRKVFQSEWYKNPKYRAYGFFACLAREWSDIPF